MAGRDLSGRDARVPRGFAPIERSKRRCTGCKLNDRIPDVQIHQERLPGIQKLGILNAARPRGGGHPPDLIDLAHGSGSMRLGLSRLMEPNLKYTRSLKPTRKLCEAAQLLTDPEPRPVRFLPIGEPTSSTQDKR